MVGWALKTGQQGTGIRWGRLAVIVTATYLVGSALIVPQFNPLLRGWYFSNTEETTLVVSALNEIAMAQSLLADAMPLTAGDEALDRVGLGPGRTNFTELETRPPNQLIARMRRMGFLDEELLAAQMLLTMDLQTRTWSCEVTGGWPDRLLPDICRREPATDPVTILQWALGLAIAIIAVLAGFLWFANPLVRPIQRNPRSLLKLPVTELPKLDRVLGFLRRKKALLALAGIDSQDWTDAVSFPAQSPPRRAELLALRLQARCQIADAWDLRGDVFEWQFVHDLPISLQQLIVFIPDLEGRELVQYLKSIRTGLNVMLVMPPAASAELEAFCRESAQLFACLPPPAQTGILLGTSPSQTLVRTLARQLPITRISPYQTRGGITRPSAFFGRRQILTRIVNREPGNYLVVGGRQLGKTSLLKAVERHLQHQPDIRCVYLSLRDHRLAPRLATVLGLPADDDIDSVLSHVAQQAAERRLLLLIDEADLFMAHESRSGFQQLAAMRALSDEGRCHFVLAGFWELYAAASMDYQSPVRNFGEVITIGALEAEACRRLASEPLALLGIRYADDSLVDEVVLETGGRANLIAMVCQECLEHLAQGRDVIGATQLRPALASQAVIDALGGWTRLSGDPQACQVDRAIVYLIASREQTLLSELLVRLGTRWTPALIQASLQRLRLAFVVLQDGHQLRFAVPLLSRQFDTQEAAAYLKSELAAE